jgi:hypothetical protein
MTTFNKYNIYVVMVFFASLICLDVASVSEDLIIFRFEEVLQCLEVYRVHISSVKVFAVSKLS